MKYFLFLTIFNFNLLCAEIIENENQQIFITSKGVNMNQFVILRVMQDNTLQSLSTRD